MENEPTKSEEPEKFDENGFPLYDEDQMKKIKEELKIPVETAEVLTRQTFKKIADALRKKGLYVPDDPKEESEFIEELLKKISNSKQ